MTRYSAKTPENLIGPTFVGKRVNWLGNLGTVINHGNKLCEIKLDDWKITSVTMQKVMAVWPVLINRDSFNYCPGDKEE